MNKHHLLSLGCAALMLASCTDDALDNGASNGHGPEADSNVVTMTVLDGASQQGRIYSVPSPDTRALKSQRLQYVATIENTDWQDDKHVWSATSVYLDDETKQVYVTWHSDKQAHTEAQTWGGALDIISIANEDKPQMVQTAASADLLKFNHVMKYGDKLFLSGNHPTKGGVVARIALNNLLKAEVIGFPGSSVNAVAEYTDGNLIAVSGFKGTYGTFEPNVKEQDYDYLLPDNNEYLKLFEKADDDFGGKYVVKGDDGNVYLLRQNGRGANDKGQIIDVANEKTIPMSVSLLSDNKWAEDYDPETGDWKVEESSGQSVYYGKHVMVVRDGYAYVAAGQNGLYKYNLASGEETRINKVFTTGLYADDEFLYTAGGSGLRIYQFQEDGTLPLYAFEVETYNKQTGAPTSKDAATTGYQTDFRHSPNFVAAHYNADKKNTYIYIAYGQSGVRVYKFAKEGEEQPEEPGDDHPYVDPGEDSPIVWATEDIEGYYAWGEIFHADSGDNTWETFEADEYGLSFTAPDGTVVTNDESYWAREDAQYTHKVAYIHDNYRYIDGTTEYGTFYDEAALSSDQHKEGKYVTMTKYTLDGGKTVLDPVDDVATMRWGNGWRMPTIEEWQAMQAAQINMESNVTDEATGRKGYAYSFENGAVLFFPYTGYYNSLSDPSVWTKQNESYYWSSTLSNETNNTPSDRLGLTGAWIYTGDYDKVQLGWSNDAWAWMPDFYYGAMFNGQMINHYDRAAGFKVRAVKAKKDMPEKFPEWQNK